MNNRYEWDEAVIPTRGLSLVGRAWARFCPAKTKADFAKDPIGRINKLRLWITIAMGAVWGPLVTHMALGVIYWPWLVILLPVAAWVPATVYVLLGGGRPTDKIMKDVFNKLLPGDGHQTDEIRALANCLDRVWAVEIASQVLGVRNQARLQQDLMRQTVDTVEASQPGAPAQRL